MKIRRRKVVKIDEWIEDVELVEKHSRHVMVRLKNGDTIKRKNRDVIEWDKELVTK